MSNESTRIYLFYCASNGEALELARGCAAGEIKAVPVPCSGKIDILYLTKAFETGAEGVAVVTCRNGECRYLEGNLRARKRVESVAALMEEAGMGRGRAEVIQIGDGGLPEARVELGRFCSRIKELSSKPAKTGAAAV